jgi:hypothetical protein
VRRVLRGNVGFGRATLEAFRRGRMAVKSRRERRMLDELASQPARLQSEFRNLSSSNLLKHFRERARPSFFPGFEQAEITASLQDKFFPEETRQLIDSAWAVTKGHRWPLLGFGDKEFGRTINWHRDPLSGRIWPVDYHADISLCHNDGSDIRVLWELNRLGHLPTLGRAYSLTREEAFAAEFFAHVESWRAQNPVGRGANWSCAMEVALRAMNLLAAFALFRNSPAINEERLLMLLAIFDQHGAHIRRHLEFSHVATSNHYLSDVAGILWIGIMFPELEVAEEWRHWALKELLREMDKQILPDGADYEGSTGYHRFVVELFLFSFILCRANGMVITDKYWGKLRKMFDYLRAIVRPDGFAPLVGDTDGGQVLPIVSRSADDCGSLLALGATVFNDAHLKQTGSGCPQELLWILGEAGLRDYEVLADVDQNLQSQAFPDAGSYVLRHEDLFLLFNTNGSQNARPSSHQHNDLLSIEVSACRRAFIVDPGTYVYTVDLHERHLFRSSSYHSTVEIDDAEQQTIQEEAPFANGGEAQARVLLWKSMPDRDNVVAEHNGYERFPEAVIHRRAITLDKVNRWWLIEDELIGAGEHKSAARFHFDAGLRVSPFDKNSAMAYDKTSGACLIVRSLDLDQLPDLEHQFTSRHYGSKAPSVAAGWIATVSVPCTLRWAIIPVCSGENLDERMGIVRGP